jgi:hypothetical protein
VVHENVDAGLQILLAPPPSKPAQVFPPLPPVYSQEFVDVSVHLFPSSPEPTPLQVFTCPPEHLLADEPVQLLKSPEHVCWFGLSQGLLSVPEQLLD